MKVLCVWNLFQMPFSNRTLPVRQVIMDELKQIANYILLHGRYQRNIGLFHGKAGIMLTMFLFSQKTGISVYHDFAEDLFDDVQNQLYDNMPIGMENGLAGIAYAMSYLANKNILSFDHLHFHFQQDQKH